MGTSVRISPLALTVLALLHHQPLHPYGMQRLIRQWGKDQVVNVSQRTSLYRTIDSLSAAGLIAVRETGRAQAYPERTVYELTDTGRQVARQWLEQMVSAPKQEYPQFPAALSLLPMVTPQEALQMLQRRADRLAETRARLEADQAAATGGLPRISMLETEYLRAATVAEQQWVRSVIDDLNTGRLAWSTADMAAVDQPGELGPRT